MALDLTLPTGTPSIQDLLPKPAPLTAAQSLTGLSGTPIKTGGLDSNPTLAINQNNQSYSPTYNNTALTPGQFNNTPLEPPKPVSVVSSAPAKKQVEQAKQVVSNSTQNSQNLYDTTNGFVTPYGLSQGAQPVQPNDPAMKKTGSTSTTTENNTQTQNPSPTPEDIIAHDGQTQYFNLATGKQEWIITPPNGGVPNGYSITDPLNGTSTDSFSSSDGFDYKQLPDGNYVKYNPTTNTYQQINAGTFSAQKQISKDTETLNNLKNNGTLTPSQQSQIDDIKNAYKDLIDKQSITNANTTGGMTVAQNMYGMGNTLSGQGEIAKTVKDGISAIAKLNNEMNKAIDAMKAGFLVDDENAVKDGWNVYNNSQAEMQKQLDLVQSNLTKLDQAAKVKQQALNITNSAKYGVEIPNDATAQEALDILNTSPKWQETQKVAASLTPEENKFMGEMALSGVSLAGMFPSLGVGSAYAPVKIAIIKSMIADAQKLGLNGQEAATMMLDKQAKAKSIIKLQDRGSQLATQEIKVENDFELVKSLGQKVDDKTLQGFVPAIQKWINEGGVALNTGNAPMNNWMGALTTTLTAYARVVAGSTGSAATTEGINNEIQGILRKGLSVKSVNEYIDSVAKPEMKNTLKGFDSSINQLQDSMNQADGTVGTGLGVSATGGTSGGTTGGTTTTTGSTTTGGFADQW